MLSAPSRILLHGQRITVRSRLASCRLRQQPNLPPFWAGIRLKTSSAQKRSYEYYRQENWFSNKKRMSSHQRNVNMAWYMTAVIIGAVGATYAAVPLYKVFCQTTGFGGTTQRVGDNPWKNLFKNVAETLSPPGSGIKVHTWTDEEQAKKLATLKPVEDAQLITVHFDTTIDDVIPWTFTPVQRYVKVVPGETALSFFRVTNHSTEPVVGVATYNVQPAKMGLYFQKIQCFCFEEQRLLPGETVDMPVFFFVDPEMLDDPLVDKVTDVTLGYTFFQTDFDDDDDDDDDDEEEESEDGDEN